MALLIGIDEAGYGPLLGPLCVGMAVFRVGEGPPATHGDPEPGADPDLWRRLEAAVCRSPRDKRGRVAVADSKKLKRPNDGAAHPLEHLERGVLAFLSCVAPLGADDLAEGDDRAAPPPVDDHALLRALGAAPGDGAPWSGEPTPLPLANDAALLGIASARLARALSRSAVRIAALRVGAIDAPDFNGAFARTRSKASINTCAAFELLAKAVRASREDEIAVTLDRHGGRIHYREELALNFPDAIVRVLDESEERSAYELREGSRRIRVSWQVEAELHHLPVALASMAAKLTRELWMARLNRFFARYLPELKPTAGYVEDGRRWLAEVEPHLPRIGLDRARLVRNA